MTSFAQDSNNSKSPVDRNAVLNRLLVEAETSRELIKQMKKREADLSAELQAAADTHREMSEAYKQSLIELGELRASIKFHQKAEAGMQEQIQTLREEKARLNGELKSARKREMLNALKDIVLFGIMVWKR